MPTHRLRLWHRLRPSAWISLTALGALCVGVLAACGGSTNSTRATIPSFTIVAKDYTFTAPQGLHAGLVALKLDNQGSEDHHAQLFRLNDGVTQHQFSDALHEGPDKALALGTTAGGPGVVAPGGQQEVMLDLPAGQYVMICLVSGPDGHMHAEKGMISFFTVDAASGQVQPSQPVADREVNLHDFGFSMPSTLNAGAQTLKVTNDGPQPHEMSLVKLADGKTIDDMRAFMSSGAPEGPPPFTSVGGMQAIAPHTAGWLKLNLQPGNYVALCFVPDPTSGKAHAELGMVMPFTVA